jgi:hypothetical protein
MAHVIKNFKAGKKGSAVQGVAGLSLTEAEMKRLGQDEIGKLVQLGILVVKEEPKPEPIQTKPAEKKK